MDKLKKAYELAKQLKKLAPWEFMEENEIFGVRIPGTDKQYFLSVMGSNGEHFALAAYEDTWGLYGFWELEQPDSWVRPMELMLIPHLMVSFESREMIDPKEIKTIQRLGLSFRGKNAWPIFRHVIPGFVPELPDDTVLDHLIIIIEQAIYVIEQVKINPEIIYPEKGRPDDYYIRVCEDNPSSISDWKSIWWKFEPPNKRYKMKFIDLERDKIAKLPRSKDIFQADIAIMSSRVAEPGKKHYFPSIFILTDKHKDLVLNFEILTPVDGIDAMHGRFPDLLIKSLIKMKVQPSVIEIRHPALYQMAKEVLYPSKIKIVLKSKLDQLNKVLDSFDSASF